MIAAVENNIFKEEKRVVDVNICKKATGKKKKQTKKKQEEKAPFNNDKKVVK
jgi:hypothetical protein